MPTNDPADATHLLQLYRAGDSEALERLFPLVNSELRRVAGRLMRGETTAHTLQPTALVNEAFVRLFGEGPGCDFEDRMHFIRVAARVMRNILIDHARSRRADKRGGDRIRLPFDDVVAELRISATVDDFSTVLQDLQALDPELAQIVDLRFFAGFSIAETARILDISTPTVERRWRIARAWLKEALLEL